VTQADNPGVVVWPPLLFGIGVLAVLLLSWLWPLPAFFHPATVWVGVALLSLGVACNAWGQGHSVFGKWLPIKPKTS
jgi:hypothetical protein